jgi:hypothetical protein
VRLRSIALALGASIAPCAEPSKPAPEPKIVSVFPMGSPRGSEFDVTVRGVSLAGARSVQLRGPLTARVKETTKDSETLITVSAGPSVQTGIHSFRIVTVSGVSNEGELRIGDTRTIVEGEALGELPVVVNGVIAHRGEEDSYWVEAKVGEIIRFEVVSGFEAFDPLVSLWSPVASWFEGERLERIAVNDEPLSFPGLSTNAHLTHRFDKAGRYCVKVAAFHGQGGQDYVYQLRIARGAAEPVSLHPERPPEWPERWFTRRLGPEWLARVALRGAEKPVPAMETYRAVVEGSGHAPVINGTGMIEGRFTRADEAHEIRLKITEPRDLAIEVETPEATVPRFNPVVRVMQPDGHEVVSNVYTKRNNNGLYMMKMIQAKTTVTLRSVGEYRIQIRDITSDCWAPDFAYRVLIRPRIAHLGEVKLVEDRVNLEPGQAKPLTVNVDREEGFKGFVAVSVEGLPAGVTAIAGLENPVETPPLPNAGRRERYYPVPQTATVMLVAAPDAAPTETPVFARVVVRPVVAGLPGEPVLTKDVPVMVVMRRPS